MASSWTSPGFSSKSGTSTNWMDSNFVHDQSLSQLGSPPDTTWYQSQSSTNSSRGSLIPEISEWPTHNPPYLPYAQSAPVEKHQGRNAGPYQPQHLAAHDALQVALSSRASIHTSPHSITGLPEIRTPHEDGEPNRGAPNPSRRRARRV
ncbi:uncharacterized protein N7496_012288 [Penicillium cataractarum]|uniref:Uncharacterized protein n=1 Tax=Penicillium cataractarum TaxID=2100454 RepID=A0A9W9UUD2_9EURO|nr:uncharacterized protein N7496_012288 [Penicillium cataractarum]KAJ5355076.1 hypothetical protein N7496_012288 [Penicillium cataractarum]